MYNLEEYTEEELIVELLKRYDGVEPSIVRISFTKDMVNFAQNANITNIEKVDEFIEKLKI